MAGVAVERLAFIVTIHRKGAGASSPHADAGPDASVDCASAGTSQGPNFRAEPSQTAYIVLSPYGTTPTAREMLG